MPKPPKTSPVLLIFDLDGTLIDSRRDLCTAVNLMRGHYALPPLPLDTVAGFVGDGVRKLVIRSLPESGVNPAIGGTNPDEAVRLMIGFYRAHLTDETVLYPGVRAGMEALWKAGFTLALISNKVVEACETLLRHFGIRPFFSSVLGGDSGPALKPDPAAILETLRALQADPGRTWMVGDHVADLQAARAAGVRSVFVTYGIGHKGAETPDKTFDAFNDLAGFFLREKVE
ncbi:MAG: HAD-IA family hydrolase [Lentisphaerae bacterium]|nr:HAD-IA family hydrolase [Lentisphaerota bacterium]